MCGYFDFGVNKLEVWCIVLIFRNSKWFDKFLYFYYIINLDFYFRGVSFFFFFVLLFCVYELLNCYYEYGKSIFDLE